MNEPEPERTTGERSYGRRFLEELQSLVGPSAGLDYATIQKLKTADREGTIAVLRGRCGGLSYAAIQAIRRSEPEELARRLHAERLMAAAGLSSSVFQAGMGLFGF